MKLSIALQSRIWPRFVIRVACGAFAWEIALAQPGFAAVRSEFVDPLVTDPAIRPLNELPNAANRNLSHFVSVDPDIVQRGRLYVHLPGSGGTPDNSQLIVLHAASLGFHVVSLAYPNYPSVRDLTLNATDPNLPGAIRRERIYGEDTTNIVDVSPADSIQNRLVKLLQYNHKNHPSERWGTFFDGTGSLRWNLIVVGGHSQGAGHAVYIAKDHKLAGVVIFAGLGDFVAGTPASWVSLPSQTPPIRMFAFTHAQDPSALAFLIIQNRLGLDGFGPVVNVDGVAPPYHGSHRLTSNLAPGTPEQYHGAVVVDRNLSVLGDGVTPAYLPVWTYMLEGPGASIPAASAWALLTIFLALLVVGIALIKRKQDYQMRHAPHATTSNGKLHGGRT